MIVGSWMSFLFSEGKSLNIKRPKPWPKTGSEFGDTRTLLSTYPLDDDDDDDDDDGDDDDEEEEEEDEFFLHIS